MTILSGCFCLEGHNLTAFETARSSVRAPMVSGRLCPPPAVRPRSSCSVLRTKTNLNHVTLISIIFTKSIIFCFSCRNIKIKPASVSTVLVIPETMSTQTDAKGMLPLARTKIICAFESNQLNYVKDLLSLFILQVSENA